MAEKTTKQILSKLKKALDDHYGSQEIVYSLDNEYIYLLPKGITGMTLMERITEFAKSYKLLYILSVVCNNQIQIRLFREDLTDDLPF